MRIRRAFLAVGIILLAAGAPPAVGALIAVDDPTFGPGSFTRDTDTALEWLDLRFTAGKSYGEVTQALAVGEPFYGLSLASVSDVETFFIHAGATIGTVHGVGPGDQAYDSVAQLLDLVGALSSGFDSRTSFALTSSQAGSLGLRVRRRDRNPGRAGCAAFRNRPIQARLNLSER